MPFLGGDAGTLDTGRAVGAQPTQGDLASASQFAVQQHRGLITTALGDVAMGAVDLADTVASSVPFSPLQRGDVNQAALNAIDSPGLNDFYHDNKGGIEATSGIGGAILMDMTARRLTAPVSAFMSGVSKLPFARRLATLDTEYANAMQTVRNVDYSLASRGAIGAEQFTGRSIVDDVIYQRGGTFLPATREVARGQQVLKAKALSFGIGARNAVATEALMGITLNQNGFLYDDEASHNLTWMALGVATGGMAEWLHTAYSIRKSVNSDGIRRAFASALDPGDTEASRTLWHGKTVAPENEYTGFLGGAYTDQATNIFLSAYKLKNEPVTHLTGAEDVRALMSNRDSLANQHFELGNETLQKVTVQGINTDGRTRFSMTEPGLGNHMRMMALRDPAAFQNVEMIGQVGDSTIHKIHGSHMARLEEQIDSIESKLADPSGLKPDDANALQEQRRRLQAQQEMTPMAFMDGEKVPLSEAESIEGFVEPEIIFSPTPMKKPGIAGLQDDDRHGLWEARTESKAQSVSLDSGFTLHLPGDKTLDTADHFDILRAYRLGQEAIPQMAKFKGPLMLPKNPNFFQLDMAEQILQKNPQASIVFPPGMTRDTAQVESFVQKVQGLKKQAVKESRLEDIQAGKGNTYDGILSKLRVRYNIPRLTAYERGVLSETQHPVEQLARGAQNYSPADLKDMSLQDIKDVVARYKRLGDVAPVSAKDIDSLAGNSFSWMRDDKGQPLAPMLAYERPFKPNEWTEDHIAERLAARNLARVTAMTDERAAPLTKALAADAMASPDMALASRSHELMDTQIQGNLAGTAPQTLLGSVRNATRSSEWRDRDSPILLAASRFRDSVSRKARDYMKATIENAFGDSLGVLANPRNAQSKLLLDQFHSFRSGWDLSAKTTKTAEGHTAFTLLSTPENKARFSEFFGREMPEGQPLIAPNGKQVVLDDLATDIQTRYNQVTSALVAEKNTLLRANGRPEIKVKDWYTPPPNTQGKLKGFVIGPTGKPVANMTVIENTQQAFDRAKEALNPKLNQLGMGYSFHTEDEIRHFGDIWDKNQMDFIDPGTTAVQPGKQSGGRLLGIDTKIDAFDDALKYLRNQYLSHADDVVGTIMKDPINAAKARAAIATDTTRSGSSMFRRESYNSIYDMWLENLTGKSKLDAPGSAIGWAYNGVEGFIDKALSEVTPPVSKVWAATRELLMRATPWSKTQAARKDFETLSNKLGPYMPFDSATKMMERQGAGTTPPTIAGITGAINRVTAGLTLRMFEVAHPIMNLTGMVNAMPSVIRNMTPRKAESAEEFADRIGHVASIFNLKDGKQLGVIDMAKIGSRAFKRAWSRESEADYKYMVQRGYLSQEVAEFHRQFGAIDGESAMKRFFGGAMDKVSWMSDHSEDMSRSWGHMAGLELADVLGIESREARHGFAHDIANKMIANYSPANRPEVFQGAIGAPFGLFQSFALNYYERLFRYAETKEYKALGIAYSMQSALFGVTGVPGYQQMMNMLTDSKGGSPTDGLYERFRGPVGDVLGGGAISALPSIFGLDKVDLYSRGDINARVPGLPTGTGSWLDTVPGFSAIRKAVGGIVNGMSAMANYSTLTTTQLAEIASNAMANRPMAGMIEQVFSHGNDTDSAGQLVNTTKTNMEVAYRMLGLRSERQSREVDAFYRNKNAQEAQAGAKEELRLATRASMRAGTFPTQGPAILDKYLKSGGDPRFFRRWIKEQYESATITRSERQLKEAIHSGKMDEVTRLIDAGVGINADHNTADPQTTWQAGQGDELNQDTTDVGEYTDQTTLP